MSLSPPGDLSALERDGTRVLEFLGIRPADPERPALVVDADRPAR